MSEITKKAIFGGNKIDEAPSIIEENKSITNIDIERLVAYRSYQPFSSLKENKRAELLASIERNGVLEAIIVRPIEDDKYEILSGHNRVSCCKELNINTIPAKIVEADDDLAEYIMLDTNLCRREELLPIEKGEAYKQQLSLIIKTKNSGDQVGNERSIVELSRLSEDSKSQIQRYIRLTYLIPEFKEKVNNGIVSVGAGYEISYISEEEQKRINEILDLNKLDLSIAYAEMLRSKKGTLDEEEILDVLTGNSKGTKKQKVEFKFTGKLKSKTIKKYKDKFNDNNEFNELVEKLLDEYFTTNEE